MKLQTIKEMILNNQIIDSIIIFVNVNNFVTNQYIKKISEIKNKKLIFVDSLDDVNSKSNDLFDFEDNFIYVYKTKEFEEHNKDILLLKNLIVVCEKFFDSETKNIFEDVSIINEKSSDLEAWQIDDFIRSQLTNLDSSYLDLFKSLYSNNIYQADIDIKKLTIFDEKERPNLVKQFIKDNVFSNSSNYTIFSFTNALLARDINQLKNILDEFERIDIEPLGVVTIMYNNIKNILNIQLDPNATPVSLNMKPNQFAAIKHRVGQFSDSELKKLFLLLTSIDFKLKTGEIEEKYIIDYIVSNIFSV